MGRRTLRSLCSRSLHHRLRRHAAGLAAAFALAAAAPASAQLLDPDAAGALVVVPYLTSDNGAGRRSSEARVTNHDFVVHNLHLTFVRGADWTAIDYDCPLAPQETTRIRFTPGSAPNTLTARFACGSDPWHPYEVTRQVGGPDGLLVIALEQPPGGPGRTLQTNVLLATAKVTDAGAGTSFSVPGIHVQGVAGPLGDRLYRFDATAGEYLRFPSQLTAEFAAPDDFLKVELVLFTPDGRVGGGPGVRARLTGFAFDALGRATSGALDFDCFTILDPSDPFRAFGANVRRDVSGSLTARLELSADIAVRSDAHDLSPPTGAPPAGARRAPVHGWVVQHFLPVSDVDLPMGMAAVTRACTPPCAVAAQLGQGAGALVPLGADVPALDAR